MIVTIIRNATTVAMEAIICKGTNVPLQEENIDRNVVNIFEFEDEVYYNIDVEHDCIGIQEYTLYGDRNGYHKFA